MDDNVENELRSIALGIAVDHITPKEWWSRIMYSSGLPRLFIKRFVPTKIVYFEEKFGASALNTALDDKGRTLLDVAKCPSIITEIYPDYKPRANSGLGNSKAIEALTYFGAKTQRDLAALHRSTESSIVYSEDLSIHPEKTKSYFQEKLNQMHSEKGNVFVR